MLARGYDGSMPALRLTDAAAPIAWAPRSTVPVAAALVLAVARGWM